jgi:hypothetical protein
VQALALSGPQKHPAGLLLHAQVGDLLMSVPAVGVYPT